MFESPNLKLKVVENRIVVAIDETQAVSVSIWRRQSLGTQPVLPCVAYDLALLVLNRNWQPVNVATVARALVLLWNEAARVVDVADYQTFTWNDWSKLRPHGDEAFVQAISMRLRVPEVITLSSYDRMPASTVTFSRRNIFKRDRYVCQYCGNQPGTDELTIDHVVPRAQGGVSSWTNCVLACVACNKRKADRSPREVGIALATTCGRHGSESWYSTSRGAVKASR